MEEIIKHSKEPKHRDWIKLHIKECLLGTIREDLTIEERSIWYDFLILGGNSRVPGVICANQQVPYTTKRIGQILNVPEKLISHCIERFESSSRVQVREGLIYIINWDKYQYSDYDRQKPYREKAKHNAQWDAMSNEDKQAAIEAFGPVESWDEMTWIAATGKLADKDKDFINSKIREEGGKFQIA